MSNILQSENQLFTIEIADDKFSAFLTVESTAEFMNEQDLLDLIAQSGITYGFTQAKQMIEAKNIQKQPGQPFPLAIGDIAKAPEIEFSPLINLEKCYDATLESDFVKIKTIQRIAKGEPLAHLFITKPSKVGINIYGVEVAPEAYDAQLINGYLGDNVIYSADRGQILADKSGYPYMDELSRMHVRSDFTLDKNLDLTFTETEFFGNLIVNGDIMDKVSLKITGDLIVNGSIVDADIDVDGDITVEGIIKDCKEPGVIATGSINFHSAENSKIVAGQTVNFKKSITFCKVLAENGLYGSPETSTIVGGVSQSGEHVEVAIIGNTGSIGTEVEISISPYTKEKMLNISKQMMKLRELNLTKNTEYTSLQDDLSELETKLEDKINSMIKNIENLPRHIMVYKKIFPGSYIRILKKSIHISEEYNKVCFNIVNGELLKDTFN
jgi:uncharacterized protein (DUF342 family)